MEKALKDRQIYLFFLAFLPTVKLFELPGILAKFTGEDMWISASLSAILDILTLTLILFAGSKSDMDFNEILQLNFGKVGAKIILGLYAVMFILKAILPINEQREFVELTLYETLPNPLTFFPFFIVSFFFCIKKLRVLGRCSDLMWLISAFGVFLLIALSVESTDFGAILPVGAHGITSSLNSVYKTSNWFGDCVYMLFFIGKYKRHKRSNLKIISSYAISSVVVIFFMIVFYGIFTSIALRQPFALIKISKYATSVNNTGRFDYVGIMFIVFSQIFAVALPLYFSTFCIGKIFNLKSKIIPAIIPSFIVFVITAFLHQYFTSIENFIINYGGIIFIVFCNLLPSLLFLLKKEDVKYAQSLS